MYIYVYSAGYADPMPDMSTYGMAQAISFFIYVHILYMYVNKWPACSKLMHKRPSLPVRYQTVRFRFRAAPTSKSAVAMIMIIITKHCLPRSSHSGCMIT